MVGIYFYKTFRQLTKLSSISNATSKALKTLNVKNADPHVAAQRLLLFNTSRRVLKHGLEVLGLKVLNEM